jgi:DNA-binding PucR family transcriptional regulator
MSRGNHVVVLARDDDRWQHLGTVVRQQSGDRTCRIGAGSACIALVDYPHSYREAQVALRVPVPEAAADGVVRFDQLGVYQLLAHVEDVASVERFSRAWLGPLMDYDQARGADLVHTLSRFLDLGGNYDAAAEAISVHRSTLKYRLQRIREISGHDLTDPDTRFNLELATRAWRTVSALNSDDPTTREAR